MIDILIIIDNPYRELLNLKLLKKVFSKTRIMKNLDI